MQTKKEQFLLFRIRAFKDETAFTELHKNHAPAVLRFLAGKLPSPQDADDALTATFLRAWNYALSSDIEHFSGLIFTIARGVVAEFYRSRKAEVSLEGLEHAVEPLSDQSGEKLAVLTDDAINIARIRTALSQLPEEQQTMVSLRFFHDLSIREIAERMQKTENAVRVAIHRAVKTLRNMIEGQDGL